MTIRELYRVYKEYPNVCTDTRKAESGTLFFALKGANFNGNAFAKDALSNGCAYAVIDEPEYKTSDRYLLVDDVLTTLQELATYHRKQLKIPVIGITGSNGKTTTKELLHAVLSTHYRTYSTKGNFNNHIGVPLTLLAIEPDCEMAIVEMGANNREDIAELCEICLPDGGIITNIGKAHLEGFGGIEGVKYAKSRLYEFLRKTKGLAFVNADNDLLMDLSEGIRRVTFGSGSDNFVSGGLTGEGPMLNVTWKSENGTGTAATQLTGNYNLENALAAVCVGSYFGLNTSKMEAALKAYTPSNNRSQLMKKGSNTVVMDAYNANPVSMKEALNNFAQLEGKKKLPIVGDMFELGEWSAEEHQAIVHQLTEHGFDQAWLVGKHFAQTNRPDQFLSFEDTQAAIAHLEQHPVANSTVLLKASRGIRLEDLLEKL